MPIGTVIYSPGILVPILRPADQYVGTDAAESVYLSDAAKHGWTKFYMNGGDDYVHMGGAELVHSSYYFDGGAGKDYFFGGGIGDTAYGGIENDELHGDFGDDYLNGGDGDDTLNGGVGADMLLGGAGADTFQYHSTGPTVPVETGITTATADKIEDWNAAADQIDLAIAGSSMNYAEAFTNATSIGVTAATAEFRFPSTSISHVFLHNSGTNTGYLLSDLDNDDIFETGIVLTGAGSATAMNWSDII